MADPPVENAAADPPPNLTVDPAADFFPFLVHALESAPVMREGGTGSIKYLTEVAAGTSQPAEEDCYWLANVVANICVYWAYSANRNVGQKKENRIFKAFTENAPGIKALKTKIIERHEAFTQMCPSFQLLILEKQTEILQSRMFNVHQLLQILKTFGNAIGDNDHGFISVEDAYNSFNLAAIELDLANSNIATNLVWAEPSPPRVLNQSQAVPQHIAPNPDHEPEVQQVYAPSADDLINNLHHIGNPATMSDDAFRAAVLQATENILAAQRNATQP